MKIFVVVLLMSIFTACGTVKPVSRQEAAPSPQHTPAHQELSNAPEPTVAPETPAPTASATLVPSAKPTEKPQQDSQDMIDSTASPTPTVLPENQTTDKTSQGIKLVIIGEEEMLNTVTPYVEGETAAEQVKRVAEAAGIPIKIKGNGSFSYIQSIGGLREFDRGPMSGWTYYINGVYQQHGAGSAKLKAGDTVEWKYTQ